MAPIRVGAQKNYLPVEDIELPLRPGALITPAVPHPPSFHILRR